MNMEEKVRREQLTNWWEWNHNQIAGGETSSLLSSKEEFSHRKKMVTSQNWGTYHWLVSSKTLKMDWYCASWLMESNQIKWDMCCYGRDQISTYRKLRRYAEQMKLQKSNCYWCFKSNKLERSVKRKQYFIKRKEIDSKDREGTSEGENDGTWKSKKYRFYRKIHRPRMCPAYGKECRKCKKKNNWASGSQSKAVNKTK